MGCEDGCTQANNQGHTATVNSVSFSPDGKTLASTSGKEIHLLDAKTGAYKRKLKGHTATINSVSFSPDGKTLASGGWDKTIGLWDARQVRLSGRSKDIPAISVAFHSVQMGRRSQVQAGEKPVYGISQQSCIAPEQGFSVPEPTVKVLSGGLVSAPEWRVIPNLLSNIGETHTKAPNWRHEVRNRLLSLISEWDTA